MDKEFTTVTLDAETKRLLQELYEKCGGRKVFGNLSMFVKALVKTAELWNPLLVVLVYQKEVDSSFSRPLVQLLEKEIEREKAISKERALRYLESVFLGASSEPPPEEREGGGEVLPLPEEEWEKLENYNESESGEEDEWEHKSPDWG